MLLNIFQVIGYVLLGCAALGAVVTMFVVFFSAHQSPPIEESNIFNDNQMHSI